MKKVLATAMAGAMIFGMSSAAFAASELRFETKRASDRYYDLFLYDPSVSVAGVQDPTYTNSMLESTRNAFKDFQKEYAKFESEASTLSGARDYFYANAGSNVVTEYLKFLSAANNDASANPNVASVLGLTPKTFNNGGDMKFTKAADGSHDVATLDSFTASKIGDSRTYDASQWDDGDTSSVINGLKNGIDPEIWEDAINDTTDVRPAGAGAYRYSNKDELDISSSRYDHHMYNYGIDEAKEVKVNVYVRHKDSFRVDVNDGKVTVSEKKVRTTDEYDVYRMTIKANAGVRDFELDGFTLELDVRSNEDSGRDPGVFFFKGDVAYSDYRDVEPDDRMKITKSNIDEEHNDGCVFKFNQKIDEETRIICNEYVDLYFDGNYGTDMENLRVMDDTDGIKEIEDFFEDYDIDYYDFVGRPKFASSVTCIIDADANSYIYEFDAKTGELENITDECDYTSDGWKFKRKEFKTYVIMEEEYDGGNTKASKEEVVESEPEPEPEPSVSEPAVDDSNDQKTKPNPGTGAYPA